MYPQEGARSSAHALRRPASRDMGAALGWS
jgi:hypothetical protein